MLRRVTLDIKAGEFVSIMGPSGAGKSTLLHILGMHDTRLDRRVLVQRRSRCTRSARRSAPRCNKKHIGFVFQSYHLLDNLTVYENLDIPLSYRNIRKQERDSIVCDILDRFQIVGKKDLYPNQLSGGQQQLVAVARAVIASPKVILADEPTGNLHSEQGREIMELFKKLNGEGTTIVQVTHSEANAALRRSHHPPARRLARRRVAPTRATARQRAASAAAPSRRHAATKALPAGR